MTLTVNRVVSGDHARGGVAANHDPATAPASSLPFIAPVSRLIYVTDQRGT